MTSWFKLGGQNLELRLVTVPTADPALVCCSLMLACYSGHLDVVKYLRKHGASWEARDLGGCTALHWAADGGHCPVIDWMIKDGCEVWPSLLATATGRPEPLSCGLGEAEPAQKGLWFITREALEEILSSLTQW